MFQDFKRTDSFKGADGLKLQCFKSLFSFYKNDCQNELLYHNNGRLSPELRRTLIVFLGELASQKTLVEGRLHFT